MNKESHFSFLASLSADGELFFNMPIIAVFGSCLPTATMNNIVANLSLLLYYYSTTVCVMLTTTIYYRSD